jgi:hypothetical protein
VYILAKIYYSLASLLQVAKYKHQIQQQQNLQKNLDWRIFYEFFLCHFVVIFKKKNRKFISLFLLGKRALKMQLSFLDVEQFR